MFDPRKHRGAAGQKVYADMCADMAARGTTEEAQRAFQANRLTPEQAAAIIAARKASAARRKRH